MKVWTRLEDMPRLERPVITIGNFDGVHLGHRRIFEEVTTIAARNKADSLVITFHEHPRKVLYPEINIHTLSTPAEREEVIAGTGIGNLLVVRFTPELAAMHAGYFVVEVLVKKLGMRHIVMGYDHAFGKNREGNIDSLIALGQRNNFEVTSIPPLVFDGHPVSSTWCRAALEEGDVSLLKQLLGRPYLLRGVVVTGFHRGHELGFPTANLKPDSFEQMFPAAGVYAVKARLADGRLVPGVCNIGNNPTFHNAELSIEAHLFDFNEDIYGQGLELEFIARLRGEVSFVSVAELALQISRDIELARGLLRDVPRP